MPISITDWIAIYGAGLSTYLLFNELRKERIKLEVILQYIMYYEVLKLIIINSGTKPVTIASVEADYYVRNTEGGNNHYEKVPQNAIFIGDNDYEKLPVQLKEGDRIEFTLSDVLHEAFHSIDKSFIPSVRDVSGKKYQVTRCQNFNPKLGGYETVNNRFTDNTNNIKNAKFDFYNIIDPK